MPLKVHLHSRLSGQLRRRLNSFLNGIIGNGNSILGSELFLKLLIARAITIVHPIA